MVTRREWLGMTVGAGTGLALTPQILAALQQQSQQALIMRAIPKTGEKLPAVGLGSSATFSQVARTEDVTALRGVLSTLIEKGGRVFDTAPSYGASEEVAGRIVQETNATNKIFWATKVNVARRGDADPAAARAQIETSFRRVGKTPIDLIQVHNMGALSVQLPILRELKQAGRIRYLGITTTSDTQYEELARVIRSEDIDFIGTDYAVDERAVEQNLLPACRDRGVAVLGYVPFGRRRLWARVANRPVPDYAKEFDAHTWAQFFIKFVLSHPAITVVTPATSQPKNMADNMGGAMGRLPDEAMRRRMIATVDALPPA